ncbi:MAG: response regulator [Myxococcaceae bacterium]|nr:response regulator [Myxococcaceae bacterium]
MDDATRVLIVDDDRFVRMLLKDALSDGGYHFTEASDGEEALEKLKADPQDVVLLDLFMPKMSGIEALTEIQRIAPGQKVLVISSLDSDALVAQALQSGAAGFIQKPFHPLEIQAAVKKALSA